MAARLLVAHLYLWKGAKAHQKRAQPDLASANWTAENRRLAVFSSTAG